MSEQMKNKVVVITGSSRGFGRATATTFLEAGSKVIITSRNAEKAERAAAELHPDRNRAVGTGCEVGNPDQVAALLDFTRNTFGKVDVWINNAGIAGPYGPTNELHPDVFTKIVQTNIMGTYYGSWVAVNAFKEQGYGKLINILGHGSDKPVPFQNAYASSKSWVNNFTQTLAKEHADSNIDIFAYNPGMMTTDMLHNVGVIASYEEKLKPLNTILRMWGQSPEKPAQKLVWIASEATDGKTGKSYTAMTTGFMLSGALREGWRRLFKRDEIVDTIRLDVTPKANLKDL